MNEVDKLWRDMGYYPPHQSRQSDVRLLRRWKLYDALYIGTVAICIALAIFFAALAAGVIG